MNPLLVLPCPCCRFDVFIVGVEDENVLTCSICDLECELHRGTMLIEGIEQPCLFLEPLTIEMPE